MQNRKYFYLPNKLVTLALFLAFLLFFPACQKAYIWGIKREELSTQIRRGDFSFLDGIDFNEFNIEEILDYSPGAAYYVSYILAESGYADVAEKLLTLEWQKGSPPWKYQAAVELAQRFIKQERYEDAEHIVKPFLAYFGSASNVSRIKRIELEILYWQEQDGELLEKLNKYIEDQDEDTWTLKDPELLLFKAVACCRLNKTAWENIFRQLFYVVPASDLHARAYLFLLYDTQRLAGFEEYEIDIFKAKNLMAEGKYETARPLLKQGIIRPPKLRLKESILAWDYGIVCLKTKSLLQEAEFVETLANQATGNERFLSLEMAAKLYAANRSFKRAQELWLNISEETGDTHLKQRAQWYMLKYAIDRGAGAVLTHLAASVPDWKDFNYFSDLLEDYISSLLRAKDFVSLYQIYLIFKDTVPNEVRAQISYIVARLISLGFIKGKTLDNSRLAEQLYTKDGYYSLLAAHFLNTPPRDLLADRRSYYGNTCSGDIDKFTLGFFDFCLFEQGYTLLSTAEPCIKADALFKLAETLKARGQYLYAIRVLGLARSTEQIRLSKEEALIVYPLTYNEEITQAASRFDIDRYLFFALIRRESAFDNQIVSHAGAVGLTQLMPATAEDVARRLDVDDIDLTNPEQNASIGAFFLADLLRRLKSIPRALAAYNAGPARIRNWTNRIGEYPDDLYVEAIPILETRRFVKFVCTAAVYYSYLYDEKTVPSQRIGQLFE
ncbi:MAG: lytic transglycosylase domain-containing protein [Spirochaetales bacterium]|nr:lytic transglycosylase domain-containing protein [Spirochaetales bacterium]